MAVHAFCCVRGDIFGFPCFACSDVIYAISGGYGGGVPPLPIPNREVKPTCADGTALQCGRVGSRLFSDRVLVAEMRQGLFFVGMGCPLKLLD